MTRSTSPCARSDQQTFAEGGTLFVEFVLGNLVSLPDPSKRGDGRPDFAGQTHKYAEYLENETFRAHMPIPLDLGTTFSIARTLRSTSV